MSDDAESNFESNLLEIDNVCLVELVLNFCGCYRRVLPLYQYLGLLYAVNGNCEVGNQSHKETNVGSEGVLSVNVELNWSSEYVKAFCATS